MCRCGLLPWGDGLRATVEEQPRSLPDKKGGPPLDLPVLGQFAGYDILGRLALGGMAEILLGRHQERDGDERFLVVKRILPHFESDKDFVKMFLDEAYIGMQLEHPNICKFYQCGEDEGSHFIVMEWINGMPLGRLIRKARKHGGVSIPIALRIGAAVASALHYAHNAQDEHGEPLNLIHRDVSPHNIMVSYEGDIKLLDFGIAKADQRAYKTQAGIVKGKFAYMAPEQCTGSKVDHRLDVFALGVCMFETFTGKSLYRRSTEAATMRAVIMDPVPSLRDRIADFPEELDTIIQKALAKAANDRYASAGEFADTLDRYARSTDQVVPQRQVQQFIRQVFAEEFHRGPRVDTVPFGSSYNADVDSDSGSSAAPARSVGFRELSDDNRDGGDADLGHLLEMPAAPATNDKEKADPLGSFFVKPSSRRPVPRAIQRGRASSSRRSRFPKLLILLIIAGAGGAAYHYGDFDLLTDKGGKRALVVDANPLMQGQGSRILVASAPPGARIYLDGEEKGVTPAAVTGLPAGAYRVRLEAPGFASWSTDITLGHGETAGVTAKMLGRQGGAQPGSSGRLRIETNPPSEVFLAGDYVGRTPLEEVHAPLGRLTLDFKLDDGRTRKRKVTVKPDRVVRAQFNFGKPK